MTLRPLALLCVLGFAATFLVALHTNRGLIVDDALFRHVSGNMAVPVRAAGLAQDLLYGIDAAFVAITVLLIVGLAVAQRHVGRALAAGGTVVLSVFTAEALKHLLPRIDSAIPVGRPAGFPSGHTSIAVSLGLALVLVSPPVLRPIAALLGAVYAGGVGLSVVLLGWHYPSDVVASFFLCGFWAAALASGLSDTVVRPAVSGLGAAAAVAVAAGVIVAGLFVAGRHPAAVEAFRSARSVLALSFVIGLLSVALFGGFSLLVEQRRP